VVDGRYEVTEQLGQGGMGTVYGAKHLMMGRQVALKVLNPELCQKKETIGRFKREIMALGQFQHRNVVRLFDAGTDPLGRLYMAMEFVAGINLRDVIRDESPLPFPRAARILEQLLAGVSEGHKRHIVHRDLKSENVLLSRDEHGDESVKILDFGVAKVLESGNEEALGSGEGTEVFRTMDRVALGTPQYMSPEQAAGEGELDHRSDIYSLGVLAYELFTGVLPFEAETPLGFIGKHIVDPPRTFDEAAPDVELPPLVEPFVLKALEKDRDERYQSAKEMLDALKVLSRPPGETADSDTGNLPDPYPSEWGPVQSDDVGFKLSRSDETPAAVDTAEANKGSDSLTARQASLARHVKLQRLKVLTLVLLVVVCLLGVSLGVRLSLAPGDPQLVLAELRGELDAAIAAGELDRARELLSGHEGEPFDAQRARLERIRELATDLRERRDQLSEAQAAFEAAVESGALTPAEEAAAHIDERVEQVDGLRAQLEQAGALALAGPPPVIDREALQAALTPLREGDELGQKLVHADKLRRSGDLYGAVGALEAALELAEGPRKGRVEGLLSEVRHELLRDQAEQALRRDVPDYEEAMARLEQALALRDDGAARERLEQVRREASNQRQYKARRIANEAVTRADEALARAGFAEARRQLDEAQQALGAGELEDAWDLPGRLAALEAQEASYPAYQALGTLGEEASAASLQSGITSRQAYVETHPRGYRVDEVRDSLPELEARRAAAETREAKARLAASLDQARDALRAAEFDRAATLAREVQTQAEELGHDELTRAALALQRRVQARENLSEALGGFVRLSMDSDPNLPKAFPTGRGDHPVRGVSYDDARAYCAWLSSKLDATVRLPTEAEWARAASGGDERAYPWGDDEDVDTRAEVQSQAPAEVGSQLSGGRSPDGLLHMAGNVAEWVDTAPDGLPEQRLLKGGSYRAFTPQEVRIDARQTDELDARDETYGFRVVIEPPQD
jgi:serine/threonine protein kinase